ncbi:leukocyte-associated immunoglobulin-like receptor 2 [Petaurus breviceps papuanus]|uniref:leukocyte-associated immunoglobulin-like receptor 2 n=1 Tax=Petaurus breviceps papuanus TaxID=3040969 RepID=UPI0036D87F44
MWFWDSVLLCLGLCLGFVTGETVGKLRKPSLCAMPSSTIPVGSLVRIQCRGPPGAHLYCLEKVGRQESLLKKTHQPWPGNDISFLISGVSAFDAGFYRCSYRLLGRWSEPSDVLELVVTGLPPSEPCLLKEPSSSTSPEAKSESCPTPVPGPTEDRGTSRPETAAGPTFQDYMEPNLFRMGLAGLVLAILGVLLAWPGWRDIGPNSGRISHQHHRYSHFLRRPLTQEEKAWGMTT